jgi:hypothetical protein
MPVFTRDIYLLQNATNVLKDRMISIIPQPLTREEAVMLFPEELRHMALEAPKHFSVTYRPNHFSVKVPGSLMEIINVQFFEDDPPLIPKTRVKFTDMSPEVREKLLAWVRQRTEIGIQFGVIGMVVDTLNNQCANLNQLAFYFPAISLIMGTNPDGFAGRLTQLKKGSQPKILPAIDPWVRTRIESVSGTLAAASMLPEVDGRPAGVYVAAAQFGRVDIDGRKVMPV